jgi:hypothetical protein
MLGDLMRDFKTYSQQQTNSQHQQSDGSSNPTTNKAYTNAGSATDFAQSENASNLNNATNANNSSGANDNVTNTINMATMLAQAFAGKSEGQIWQTILAQAEQGKKNGTLTNADLDNFFATVAPLMDGFKRKKLSQIIERLKNL